MRWTEQGLVNVYIKRKSRCTPHNAVTLLIAVLALAGYSPDVISHATCPDNALISNLPVQLAFDGSAHDCSGSGFTTVMPDAGTAANSSYDAAAVATGGLLRITTTAGDPYESLNTQQNALAVRVDASAPIEIRASLGLPLGAAEDWDSTGLWMGLGEDNYVKLVAGASGLELVVEENAVFGGAGRSALTPIAYDPASTRLMLTMKFGPGQGTAGAGKVEAFYGFDGGPPQSAGTLTTVPAGFFTAASHAGVIQTNVGNSTPLVTAYDVFTVTAGPDTTAPSDPGGLTATPGANNVILGWAPG